MVADRCGAAERALGVEEAKRWTEGKGRLNAESVEETALTHRGVVYL